jgi:hypothetical protein
MDSELYRIALEHGYHGSNKSVPYKRGLPYNFGKKIEVAAAIQSAQAGSRSDAYPSVVWREIDEELLLR